MSKTVRKSTVFMMDLWATVPYYTAYLSRALLAEGVPVKIGSITYYLDPGCFSSRGLTLSPGLMDVVGRFPLPRVPRRILKLIEALLNMLALAVRFFISPPAVIHVQYLPMLRWRFPLDAWFVSFCRWRGSMIVLTVHDLLPHDTAEIYKKVFQDLYRRTDAIICHSDHIKARLVSDFGISPGNIYVIPHGPFFFDLPERSPEQTLRKMQIGDGDLLVLWQGIIFPYKGLDLLLTAWQRVEREVPHAVLVVVGTGAPELLHQISEQVQRLGLQRVRLHLRFTSTEELVDFYRAANIVVYPYRAITTSGALATGVALGKTIVASDLPVFRELLTHGEEALLVPVADTGALAGSLCKLLQDRELRERLARAVRAKDFGHQSWMSIAAKTAQVYDAVLDASDAAKTQRREHPARDAVRP